MHKMNDAAVFSQSHHIVFVKPVAKAEMAGRLRRLLENIGRPMAHNGIIVGHIKVLAKLPDEEFLFLSLTRLDHVDVQSSSQWDNGGNPEVSMIDLDINVLVFGHSMREIAEVVDGSLMLLRRDTV